MERKAKGKGYRQKSGAPMSLDFAKPDMLGGGMMHPKIHEKMHKKMGVGKTEEEDKTKPEVEAPAKKGPGKAPENKKEE